MKMIVHDLSQQDFAAWGAAEDQDVLVISDNGTIRKCTGCFGCWTKTPGRCVIKDDYQHMGELLARSDELIIITQCVYGSYSPFVLNVLNRSISYMLPYFVKKNGETHHRERYPHTFAFTVHFYGDDVTESEKETARALVAANSVNLNSTGNRVYFHHNPQAVKEAMI
ncbi:flavodoxin family protein [Paenibacillus sp. M1]|uniref:Flavodoxin family protein n=1 Tax=Paenibacillus haidiansis TaxID=1574488 RepID=A0ABU7VW78_9BACL